MIPAINPTDAEESFHLKRLPPVHPVSDKAQDHGQSFAQPCAVYVLRSGNGKFHVDWTLHLESRLRQDRIEKIRFAKGRDLRKLVCYEIFPNSDLAKKRVDEMRKNPGKMFFFRRSRSSFSEIEKQIIVWSYCLPESAGPVPKRLEQVNNYGGA